MALNSKLVDLCSKHSGNYALFEEEEALTYSDLLEACTMVANDLRPRTLVLIVASNTVECVVGYIGFMAKGIVPLMVSPTVGDDELKSLLEEYRPEYVWHSPATSFVGKVVKTYRTYQLVETGYANECDLFPDLALLLTTSGSTGSRKYVRLSYRNVESNAFAIADYLNIDETSRAITTLPLSYSYGLSIVNSHLVSGASLILTERSLFDRSFWTLLKEKEATSFGGVPYTYEMLKRLHFDRMDLPSLRTITQAGGRLGEDLHREFARICEEKSIDFVVMYGQTEATARLMYLPPEYSSQKVGFIGVPIPNGEVKLINEAGTEITEFGNPGELVYAGPNVSLGYAECRADLSQGDERDGRLETGDIAVRDEDGFYRIVGRKKRFLKMFGNRVNLDEVEGILAGNGYTAACAGEDDRMVIYLEGSGHDIGSINKLISDKLNLYKGAFVIKQINALPRNDAGKILYASLEESRHG